MAAASEKFRLGFGSMAKEATTRTATNSSAPPSSSSAFSSSDQAHQILVPRSSGRVVSLSTCTKIGAISFALGVVVGFTLKRWLRRWARRLLKRMKDEDD